MCEFLEKRGICTTFYVHTIVALRYVLPWVWIIKRMHPLGKQEEIMHLNPICD